jgi:hypothetical protein
MNTGARSSLIQSVAVFAAGLAVPACGPSAAPGASSSAAAVESSCVDALAYRPDGRAEQWVAISGSALTVTGDLTLAPSLAQFQHFRPAGLRFQGNQELGPLAAALMGGSCAAVSALVVDPAPVAGDARLCLEAEAGAIAARLSDDAARLSVAVFPAGSDPAAGADPCQAYSYVRLTLNGGTEILEGAEPPSAP